MSESFLDNFEAGPDLELPHDLTNVETFAQMYPGVPMASILRCMFEAEVEADFVDTPGERDVEIARLSIVRLEELGRRYQSDEASSTADDRRSR